MARYFFHLRDGDDILLDPEGVELLDLDTAKREALKAARDTLSHGIRDGVLDVRYRIDVEDAEGKILHSLPLCDAYVLVGF